MIKHFFAAHSYLFIYSVRINARFLHWNLCCSLLRSDYTKTHRRISMSNVPIIHRFGFFHLAVRASKKIIFTSTFIMTEALKWDMFDMFTTSRPLKFHRSTWLFKERSQNLLKTNDLIPIFSKKKVFLSSIFSMPFFSLWHSIGHR